MAIIESRPYVRPFSKDVSVSVTLAEPPTSLSRLAETWTPGDPIAFNFAAELRNDFWENAQIEPTETITLVGVVTCLSARSSWRGQADFRYRAGSWNADFIVPIVGSNVAVNLDIAVWVTGPGTTFDETGERRQHRGAKLWQMSPEIRVGLQDERSAFPTTAISFAETGRREVPWNLEIDPQAEPNWSIDSALRLYINTDLEMSIQLLNAGADEDHVKLLQSDIHLSVLHELSTWRGLVDSNELERIARRQDNSFAALGVQIAEFMNLPLSEALRLASEEPALFVARSRESVYFGQRSKGLS